MLWSLINLVDVAYRDLNKRLVTGIMLQHQALSNTMTKASKIQRKLSHYVGKAIADYGMIKKDDRVMVCLSGGKDSYSLLSILRDLRIQMHHRFELFSFTLDQSQPGWDDSEMRQWLDLNKLEYTILKRNTYAVVKDKIPEGKSYCSLCSRLRRGNIYRYAEEHGFNKIALGHHRDDLIETLLMSIMYSGQIRSMPPKLRSDNGKHVVIRPLIYCQEADIQAFADEQQFPIIPCNLCGSQPNLVRQQIKGLIADLAKRNPKIPSNMLHALSSIHPSQLMDKKHWDFNALDHTNDDFVDV